MLANRPAGHPTDADLAKLKVGEYKETANNYLYYRSASTEILVLHRGNHFANLCKTCKDASGCIGNYITHEDDIYQRIHDIFHKQLYEIQSSLNAFLELNLAKLIDTVHSLVSDSFVIPLENPDQDLIPQILELIPEYLTNHENQQI